MSYNQNVLAVKGLAGWHVSGRSGANCTFSAGPYDSPPGDCLAIDMSAVYERDGVGQSAANIWSRPTLSLSLPNGNVRSLFEGCIGSDGTTDGHAWDGKLESLRATDSVGLDVYVAVLVAAGGSVLCRACHGSGSIPNGTDEMACGTCTGSGKALG